MSLLTWNLYEKSTNLITGGSGYIGKIADRVLRNKGYKTVVVDTKPFPQHPNFILGDIRNKSLFDNIF